MPTDYQNLKTKLNDKEQEIYQIQDQIDSLQNEKKGALIDVKNISKQLQRLQRELGILKEDQYRIQTLIQQTKNLLYECKMNQVDLQTSIEALQDEINNLEGKIKAIIDGIDNLIQKLNQNKIDHQKFIKDMNDLEAEAKRFNEEIKNIKDQIYNLEKELENIKNPAEKAKLKEKIDLLKSQLREKKGVMAESNQKIKRIKQLACQKFVMININSFEISSEKKEQQSKEESVDYRKMGQNIASKKIKKLQIKIASLEGILIQRNGKLSDNLSSAKDVANLIATNSLSLGEAQKKVQQFDIGINSKNQSLAKKGYEMNAIKIK